MTAERDELSGRTWRTSAVGHRAGVRPRGPRPGEVRLVAATKTVPAEAIAMGARRRASRTSARTTCKELRAKHDAVPDVRWHFIGTLQTSTAHHVAALADVVETVAGGHATERLAGRAAGVGTDASTP